MNYDVIVLESLLMEFQTIYTSKNDCNLVFVFKRNVF